MGTATKALGTLLLAAALLGMLVPDTSRARVMEEVGRRVQEAPGDDAPPVRIGSKNFGESYLLAEIFAQLLEARGMAVERRAGLGALASAGPPVRHQPPRPAARLLSQVAGRGRVIRAD